ncbi:MAG TPA: heparan-alpha-glucosaminide N-acetyltransferase domain-containing protein [Spirochaetota bacterium]|nr:heparan-alpha-glucosaminide N-acetyltransferase domain-containing protein [Spirochaetota bacterium]
MNKRIPYIDSLRGLAVLFMVQQHLIAWLWDKKWISYSITFPEHPVMLSLNFAGNFAAPIFILLAGTGAALLEEKRTRKTEYFRRGLFILLCGYALNILSPHWFRPGSWYVLHTIGFSIIIAPLLLRFKNSYLLPLAVLIIIIPGFIRTWLQTPLTTGNSFMNDLSRGGGILRLALAEGHFPIFPWIAFFIAGIICCRWIKAGRRGHILYSAALLFISGTILKGLYNYGYFFATGGKFFRLFVFTPYIYPASPSLVFILTGIAMAFFYLFTFIKKNSLPVRVTASTGRLSLTWFFIHIVLFNEIFRLAGIHRNLPAAGTLLIITATFVSILFFSSRWGSWGYRFSIEQLMRRTVKLQ